MTLVRINLFQHQSSDW